VGTAAADALAQADELHTALGELETLLAKGTTGQVRLTDDGELIIPGVQPRYGQKGQ